MRNALIAAAAALGLAVPAQAAEPQTVTIRVRHDDLNLASADGLASLQSRVKRAIRHACRNEDANSMAGAIAETDCRDALTALAASEIESRRQRTLAMLTSPRG